MKNNELKILIQYYVKNWRVLLGVLLCAVVIACGIVVGSSVTENESTAEQSAENTSLDMHAIKVAYFHYNAVEKQQYIIENSLHMQIDCNNVHEKILTYAVDVDSEEQKAEVIEQYKGMVYDGDLLNSLQEVCGAYTIDSLSDILFVNELEEDSIIRIKICSYDEESVEAMSSVVREYVGNAQVQLTNEYYIVQREAELEKKQLDYYAYLKSCKALSDNYYSLLLPEEKEYLDDLKAGKIMIAELNGEGATGTVEVNSDVSAQGSMDADTITALLKNMVNALVVGVFVYIIVVYIRFIMNSKLQSVEEMEKLFEVPVIGRSAVGTTHRFGKALDKLTRGVMNEKIDNEFELAKIERFLHKLETKYNKLIVIADEQDMKLLQGISEDTYVKLTMVSDYMKCNELIDSDNSNVGVVMTVRVDKTKYVDITRQMKFCDEMQADIVGAIVVEER